MSEPVHDSLRNPPHDLLINRLSHLRAELTELAFALERDGDRVAADVATHAAGRVGEICDLSTGTEATMSVATEADAPTC